MQSQLNFGGKKPESKQQTIDSKLKTSAVKHNPESNKRSQPAQAIDPVPSKRLQKLADEEVKEIPVNSVTRTDQQAEHTAMTRQANSLSSEPLKSLEKLKKPSASDFCPRADSPFHIGQSMPFSFIARALSEIEECSGKNSQTQVKEIIANIFRSAIANNAKELPDLFYFFIVKLAPEYEALETNVGQELVTKCVAKACGKSATQVRDMMREEGDLGVVVSIGKKTQNTIGSFFAGAKKKVGLTFAQVFQAFLKVAKTSGNSSVQEKENIIVKLLQDGDNEEAKYIVRWMQKNLKTGAAEKTMISALARAIVYTPPNLVLTAKEVLNAKRTMGEDAFIEECARVEHAIKEAACEAPNYGAIVNTMLISGTDTEKLQRACHMRVGIPLKPMLAKPTKGVQIILKRFEGIDFTCEYKYDGFRGQIHFMRGSNGPQVQIYSRNLENMTVAYPDVTQFLASHVPEAVQSFIIDAELVAYDPIAKKILPFQLLTQRSRKNVKKEDLDTQVCLYAFDILCLNDQSLLKKNFIDRRTILHETFPQSDGRFQFAQHQDAQEFEQIETFLSESIKDCCEGLMVKTLTTNATYEPSKRSFNWLKLKKDYLETTIGDSLDLVVVGADYGTGKRTGTFGSFLLACWNDDRERLETVCKVGTGFSDEALQSIYDQLKDLTIDKAPNNLKYKDKNIDTWITPLLVWEIKAADLSLSPIYQAGVGEVDPEKGIALRFPRYIRTREDKKVEQATSHEQIVEFYKAQAAVNIDFNQNDDFDF